MKISNMRVGTRLSAGFCLVLFLMILMGISADLFTRANVHDMDDMINRQLLKERLVEEWIAQVDKNSGKILQGSYTKSLQSLESQKEISVSVAIEGKTGFIPG